ncbi:MAG: hypothetical protein OXR07_05300 [Nitrospira sp.]|nr:hypothetical protein [Nitrospira sp.]
MENVISSVLDHPLLIWVGRATTLVFILTVIYAVCLFIKGILPVLYRLGSSLSKRKVAIFATGGDFNNLRNVLTDSKLFEGKNILQIDKESIKKAQAESLMLMHWKSYQDKLDAILDIKQDTAALIVYAPVDDGPIDKGSMVKIGEHRNVIVVNFRGRLVNDVLVCMMTSRGS